MLTGGRVVLASNRGPVSFDGDGNPTRGSGGLASALGPAMAGTGGAWVAIAMTEGDRAFAGEAPATARSTRTPSGAFRLRFVCPPEREFHRYYDDVANRLIWFALHGIPTGAPPEGSDADESWLSFVSVNTRVAATCADELGPSDALLVQDYHLPLVPRLVRHRSERAAIAYFLHTPWPEPAALETLPAGWVRDIVESVLCADLIGFHSPRWARNFVETASAVTGTRAEDGWIHMNGRRARVGVFPLGPDPDALSAGVGSPETLVAVEELDELAAGRRLVLRAERLDPAKNALRGLLAWEGLLSRRPRWREEAVHLALLQPCREGVSDYVAYRAAVEEQAARIEHRFPGSLTLRVRPSFPLYAAALARYDVLLVNSVADGMNLVAKEGAIANRRDGALVLSKAAGAADRLGDAAFLVDPLDTRATEAAIGAALESSPAEKAWRAKLARRRSRESTPSTWLAAQLAALREVVGSRDRRGSAA